MALRSLGATLLAKTSPGTALRKGEEERKQGAVPQANVSAQPSSVSRSTIDQPLEVSTPGGTEKQVAVKPQLQPNMSTAPATQPMGMGNQGIVPQMGGAAAAASAGRNINAAPAPAPGVNRIAAPSVSAPILSPTGIKASSGVSSAGGVARTAVRSQPMLDMIAPTGVGEKNAPAQTSSYNPVSVPFTGIGSRVSAAEGGNNEVGRSLLQGAAATVANAIQGGGVDTKATNPVSKALINFANTPSQAKNTGILSNLNKASNTVQKAVQAAPTVLRSVATQASNTAQSAAKQVTNFLRSLFKR